MKEGPIMITDETKIRDRAYQLWDQAGQPEGREAEFWYEAERELSEEENVDISSEASKLDLPPVVPGSVPV
jgi:hypothetical protein